MRKLFRANATEWCLVSVLCIVLMSAFAHAKNHGFDPEAPTTKWFEGLKIPPAGEVSCCGKADAYAVDAYEKLPSGDYKVWVSDGAAITFPDGTQRVAWDITVPVVVPANRVNEEKDDLDNPSDHSWLFFVPRREYPANGGEAAPSTEYNEVYCFIRHPNGT